jgi:hypothetical protein
VVRSVRSSSLAVVAFAALVAAFVVAVAAGPAEASRRPRKPPTVSAVLVVGDSLAVESMDAVRWVLGGRARVETMAFGGTAWCDWLDKLPGELRRTRPAVVVFSFTGNMATPCMAGVTPATLGARFLDDGVVAADLVRAHAPSARVVVTTPPVHRHTDGTADEATVANAHRAIALARPEVRIAEAGEAVAPGSTFAARLPCMPGEAGCGSDGMVPVRAPDGIHFCPVEYGAGVTCPVASPGAFRFGAAIAGAVAELLPRRR